jgi:hypothetical protein
MKVRRNFALGALLAVAVMIPTLGESTAMVSKDNAIARFAAARNWAEMQLSCSIHSIGTGVSHWLKEAAVRL